MLFEELMMDNNTLIKFKIYKKISNINQNRYSISQIASLFHLNYQQTLIFLTEINQEIMAYSDKQTSILEKAGKIDVTATVVSIDEYRYLLLEKSIPFLFILYFMNHDHPTIEDFCSRHYVSQSTVARKMIPLKRHVKQFNLRFSFREANLIGDERIIRVALFNTLWLGTRGIVWPFKYVTQKEAGQLVEAFDKYFPLTKTYLGVHELSYFAAIFLSRSRKKLFVDYDKKYDFLMKDNPYYDFKLLNKVLRPVKQLPTKELKAESSFIFFLAHYAPFYTSESDPSFLQTMKDFSRGNNSIQKIVLDFLVYIEQELFNTDPKNLKNPLLKANLFNLFFVFYVLQQPFPNLQSLVTNTEKKPLQINEYLEKKIGYFLEHAVDQHNQPYFTFIHPSMILALRDVLLPYCNQFPYSKKLRIGMAFEHNFLSIRTLYQFLDRMDFIEVSPYIMKSPAAYDLVISSSLLPLKSQPDLPLYFMDLSYEDEDLADLYVRLHQLFKEKNTALS